MTAPSETHERRPTTEWCILQFYTYRSLHVIDVPIHPETHKNKTMKFTTLYWKGTEHFSVPRVFGVFFITTNNLTLM
jgi:hypothetical protein